MALMSLLEDTLSELDSEECNPWGLETPVIDASYPLDGDDFDRRGQCSGLEPRR